MTVPDIANAQAFSRYYSATVNVLTSDAFVSEAFNPSTPVPPNQTQFQAIWDTGATHTAITKKVVDTCGLKPTGMTIVNTSGGAVNCSTYFINLILPNHVGFHHVKVTQVDIKGGDLLIGMDVIGTGDFAISNLEGKTTFSFRIPSCECIDFVKQTNLAKAAPGNTIVASPKIGRNAKCPCGSGKKYKHCCGRESKPRVS